MGVKEMTQICRLNADRCKTILFDPNRVIKDNLFCSSYLI